MNKKKFIAVIAGVSAAAVLTVGSMAYFTDRAEIGAASSAGKIGISMSESAKIDDAMMPGDVRDLSFTVSNTGNRNADIRHTIQLTVTDSEGAGLNVSEKNGQAVFDIYRAEDVVAADAGWNIADSAKPIYSSDTVDSASGLGASRIVKDNTITYYYASDTLISAEEQTYNYLLVFRSDAQNEYQGCTVYVDILTEAKQNDNTYDSWTVVSQESHTVSASGANTLTQNAVPEM